MGYIEQSKMPFLPGPWHLHGEAFLDLEYGVVTLLCFTVPEAGSHSHGTHRVVICSFPYICAPSLGPQLHRAGLPSGSLLHPTAQKVSGKEKVRNTYLLKKWHGTKMEDTLTKHLVTPRDPDTPLL